LEAGPTLYEIAVAQARVRLAQAQSDVIRTQIEQFVLRSPLEGLVLSQVLDQGELAAPTAAILVIARLDPVTLTVYVPVNQVGQVNLGQPVDVQVDSYPERTFEGHVSRIGDEPEFTPRNIATQEERLNTFYAVQVELENPDHLLKPGMPADATFVQSEN
jgi:multidrug resistance efflux pump